MVTLPPLQMPTAAAGSATVTAEELREEQDLTVLRIKATQVCRERDALSQSAAMYEQEVKSSRAREEALRKDYIEAQKALIKDVAAPAAERIEELRSLTEALEQAQTERDEYKRKCAIQAQYAQEMKTLYTIPGDFDAATATAASAACGSASALYRELERVRAAAVEVGSQSDEAATQLR